MTTESEYPATALMVAGSQMNVGRCRGAVTGAHGICGDSTGNLFLAELPPQDVTKLERLD